MSTDEAAVPDGGKGGTLPFDITKAHQARIYDYLLGGKDNFVADREAAKRLIKAIPDVAAIARDNRSFLGRVVRYLAIEGGIRQFLDLGGGLSTQARICP
ncbi:MAG: SAM-dependent methyltransferase [Gemmatimonadales bacterium]